MTKKPPETSLKAAGSDPGEWEGTHIVFHLDGAAKGKTCRWDVSSKNGGALGVVKWLSRWRKYCFFPASDCVFEEVCMREISQFIVDRTTEHKNGV